MIEDKAMMSVRPVFFFLIPFTKLGYPPAFKSVVWHDSLTQILTLH